jgi:FkbM family methyltransferase
MDLCDEKVIVCIETFEPGGCMGAKWGKIDDLQTTQIINKFTQQFKDNDITLDIGANTGLMSLAVHRGKVISFEPTKKTYDVLLKNVLLNDKFIIPINKALWSCNVRYKIVENKKNHGENKIEFTNDGDDVTLTIDELNLNNVRLIKIDTEGADMEVVEGGLETIKRCKPLLIIESVDKEFMKSINYKCLGYSNINTIWEAEK